MVFQFLLIIYFSSHSVAIISPYPRREGFLALDQPDLVNEYITAAKIGLT